MKSRSLLAGYWNKPVETEKAFIDGWYLTNDMGYMDEDGYLFIVDRKNDMIKSGGLSVYPAEVERVLLEHPGIAEAVVVGFPDEKWGEKIVAVVFPQGRHFSDQRKYRKFLSRKDRCFQNSQTDPVPVGPLSKNQLGQDTTKGNPWNISEGIRTVSRKRGDVAVNGFHLSDVLTVRYWVDIFISRKRSPYWT